MAPSATSPPSSSALSTLIATHPSIQSPTHPPYYHHLALQVLHNLQHQHDWTELQVHTHSPLQPRHTQLLPRPLVSGLPPSRVYVHPDEQIDMLKQGVREQDVEKEREWVLPTHLREKWSLRRFAEVFDAVGEEPPEMGEWGGARDEEVDEGGEGRRKTGSGVERNIAGEVVTARSNIGNRKGNKRRGGKRVLLATVSDDSTTVYYIVHDGLVKPRQN